MIQRYMVARFLAGVIPLSIMAWTATTAGAIVLPRTVRCSWCPPDAIECQECLVTGPGDAGCLYSLRGSWQSWLAAPEAFCPPGIQRHTCLAWSFSNQRTGHTVVVPMPQGYEDQVCTVEPPLPGHVIPKGIKGPRATGCVPCPPCAQ